MVLGSPLTNPTASIKTKCHQGPLVSHEERLGSNYWLTFKFSTTLTMVGATKHYEGWLGLSEKIA